MTRSELIETLDSLCWQARRYGHDDYGLDYPVDQNGEEKDSDEDGFGYHLEAVKTADTLIEMGVVCD